MWKHKNNRSLFVVFLFFAFLTRLVSLTFLPNYDEWYYLASWNGIRNGGVLYKTILDNKPPLAYFLYIIPDIFSLYVTLSVLSAIIAFFIGKLAENSYAGHVFLLITSTVPSYLELNLEYWILACLLPAYYFILKKQSAVWHRWAYFLCGASLMIKQHSLLLVIPIILYGAIKYPNLFKKSIYYLLILPTICLLYIIYTNTFYESYLWIIEFNFWYKDLSETGGYMWKRFIYGQLFALPVYVGILLSIKNAQKNALHFTLITVLTLSIGSVWIGKELYLHYQLLIFPFLIILFYALADVIHQKYVFIAILAICIFGQLSYTYTYISSKKTWLTDIEGVVSYQEKKVVPKLESDKCIIFSSDSNIGLNYRKVKYILWYGSLEYLKKKNFTQQKQLLSCNFHLKDAVYIVSQSCLKRYVGDLKYKTVYEYGDNIGIEIESCP